MRPILQCRALLLSERVQFLMPPRAQVHPTSDNHPEANRVPALRAKRAENTSHADRCHVRSRLRPLILDRHPRSSWAPRADALGCETVLPMLGENPFTSRRKAAPPDGQHYRELAAKVIEPAGCRFVSARRELTKRAASFARRADFLDRIWD
jgi:hypothetical protein